jgi:hypothetical protein
MSENSQSRNTVGSPRQIRSCLLSHLTTNSRTLVHHFSRTGDGALPRLFSLLIRRALPCSLFLFVRDRIWMSDNLRHESVLTFGVPSPLSSALGLLLSDSSPRRRTQTTMAAATLTPNFKWGQDKKHLFVTIEVADCKNAVVEIKETGIVFSYVSLALVCPC